MGKLGPINSILSEIWQALVGLIWPLYCVGCSAYGTDICQECAPAEPVVLSRYEADSFTYPLPVPVWAMGEYRGRWRRIIMAWKRGSSQQLAQRICNLVQLSVRDAVGPIPQHLTEGEEIWVIPAPSRWQRRVSGRLIARNIAHEVARELSQTVDVVMADVLRQRGRAKHHLNQRARMAQRAGSITSVAPLGGRKIILIDDVATTGATLTECIRAISAQGGEVVAIFVLAVTPH